jgi:hypothetical protein
MSERITCAIVGCGGMERRHLRGCNLRLEDMIAGRADVYQREIYERFGLLAQSG